MHNGVTFKKPHLEKTQKENSRISNNCLFCSAIAAVVRKQAEKGAQGEEACSDTFQRLM